METEMICGCVLSTFKMIENGHKSEQVIIRFCVAQWLLWCAVQVQPARLAEGFVAIVLMPFWLKLHT